LPLRGNDEVVATSLYLSQRSGDATRLMLGKINAIDLLASRRRTRPTARTRRCGWVACGCASSSDRADARNRHTNPRGKTMSERLQRHLPFVAAALMASIAGASPVAAQQTAESIWSGGPILTNRA